MNIILLPSERYHELLKFEGFQGTPPNPDTSIVVVAEDPDSKEIKGFWVAQAVIHIEPIALDPAVRDGGHTSMKMLSLLLSELAARGEASFFAFADNESVVNYLVRLGLVPLPYAVFYGMNPNLLPQEPSECLSSQPFLQPSQQ